MKRIYLDTAAATPLDPRVARAMAKAAKLYGNPSSIHAEGLAAAAQLEDCRREIARILGAHSDEIIFTSGGTESNNLAIVGVARALLREKRISKPGHIIVSSIEHQSVLAPAHALRAAGWSLDLCPVNPDGIINLVVLKGLLRPDTVLVSVMTANNEIGTIQPIKAIAKIIRHHRKAHLEPPTSNFQLPFFHTDACQASRAMPLKVEELGVDLLTLNAAKIYGSKGIGVLYLRRHIPLEAQLVGGGQERGRRSGTESVSLATGLVTALQICEQVREREAEQLLLLRQYFIRRLIDLNLGITVSGSVTERLPSNVNIVIPGASSEEVVIGLDRAGVACSAGSACSAHAKDDSYVIIALGQTKEQAECAVRFTLDRATRRRDLDYVVKVLPEIVARSRHVCL